MSWRIQMRITELKPYRLHRTLPEIRLCHASNNQFHSTTETGNRQPNLRKIMIDGRLKRCLSNEIIPIEKKTKISPEAQQIILACGQNICGQLGFSTNIIERQKPQLVKINDQFNTKENIQLICAGAMHSCALTVTGLVYTWGCNDDGALGRMTNDIDEECQPGLCRLPEEIRMIAAGDSFTVALGKSGRVYITGCFRSSEGVLGLLKCKQIEPQAVLIPLNQSIKQVACGADFCLLLAENGELYSFGNNEIGQLGRDSPSNSEEMASIWLQPTPIPRLQGRHIVNIWAGGHGFFVLTEEEHFIRHLFACGANSFGQLGDSSKQALHSPIEIHGISPLNKLLKIACGLQHTLILDSLGYVHGLGRSDDGRLGTDQSLDIIQAKQINNLDNIVDIAAGGSVSFAISHTGEIFSFGMGDTCQTGHGIDDIFIPTIVKGKQLEHRQIKQISVGAQHTLFLVVENEK